MGGRRTAGADPKLVRFAERTERKLRRSIPDGPCGERQCLCSGGEHVLCMRGKRVDNGRRELLQGIGSAFAADERQRRELDELGADVSGDLDVEGDA